MLLWLTVLSLIAIVSLALTLRSMRNFNELGQNTVPQGLFLIRNLGEFNDQTLQALHNWASAQNIFFSLERLFKGGEQALVIYGPVDLLGLLPELDLLELEDYLGQKQELSKITSTQILGFTIPLSLGLGFIRSSFLHNLELVPTEQFFWQLMIKPLPLPENGLLSDVINPHFEVIARTLMYAESAQKRVDLAKKILPQIQYDFGLKDPLKPQNSTTIFDLFFNRTFEPEKVDYHINSQEILALLDLE